MSNYVTRQTTIPARIEVLSCTAKALPPTTRQFIWPEYTASFEAMTPNSSRDKKSWKNFEHYKRSCSPPTLISSTGAVANHIDAFQNGQHWYDWAVSADAFGWFCNEFGSAGEPFNGLQLWYSPTGDGFAPSPTDLSGYKQRSLRSMLPLIKSDLSLINFYIELKDLTSFHKTVESVASLSRYLLRGKAWENTKSTLRRLTRTSADAYLQEEFGVAPVLRDISSAFTALLTVKKRLNDLISKQGYTQKRHYKATLTVPDVTPETKSYSSPVPAGSHPPYEYGCEVPCGVATKATRYVYTDVSTFHAEIEYDYNFTRYQTEHAQLLGLLDAFGVNLNAAIIWNAIPWSFVVDWVVNVSSWLNDRRVLNMEPVINIHNYLWSWTARRRIVVYREVSHNTIYHDIGGIEHTTEPGVPMPVVTETLYKRVVEMPTSGSIASSGLSLKEFSLGAALVTVRGSHHKRSHSQL